MGIWRWNYRGELREKRMVYREEGKREIEMSREMGQRAKRDLERRGLNVWR